VDRKVFSSTVIKPIGKGKFAVVYRARRISDNETVALKRISVDSVDAKAAKILAKKLKWEQKKALKKAQKKEMKAVDSDKVSLIDVMKHPSSRPISSVNKNKADLALEERYAEVRKKLVASGKTDEEINQELPKVSFVS
jgi:serine/threonine protein kinase